MNNALIEKIIIRILLTKNVRSNMERLYSGDNVVKQTIIFYKSKIKYSVMIMMVGIVIAVGVLFVSESEKAIGENGTIRRNGYGKGDKSIEANVYREGCIEPENVYITVSEQRYTDDEIKKSLSELKNKIQKIVLGENESPDKVDHDMNFPANVTGYPFKISYKTDNPIILDKKGKIDFAKVKERDQENKGILTCVTVIFTYYDFTEEYDFYVRIFTPPESFESIFDSYLKLRLREADINDVANPYMRLPDNVAGLNVVFVEKEDNRFVVVIIISIFMAIVVFFGKDSEIDKEIEKRNAQMIKDYPIVVNKFALFYSAGLPVKTIWNLICDDYIRDLNENNKVHYVYEEMLVCNALMKEGKGEVEAYDYFAERVCLAKYKSFINILQQAVTKGKRDVGNMLIKESEEAFLERRLNAKKISEEATTKMLMPMFLMLLIVIVMIMFPAFYSFKMS